MPAWLAPRSEGETRRFAAQSSHEGHPRRWPATTTGPASIPKTNAQTQPRFWASGWGGRFGHVAREGGRNYDPPPGARFPQGFCQRVSPVTPVLPPLTGTLRPACRYFVEPDVFHPSLPPSSIAAPAMQNIASALSPAPPFLPVTGRPSIRAFSSGCTAAMGGPGPAAARRTHPGHDGRGHGRPARAGVDMGALRTVRQLVMDGSSAWTAKRVRPWATSPAL